MKIPQRQPLDKWASSAYLSPMKRIRTFDDVNIMCAGKGSPLKRDLARQMGVTPETFSRWIADKDARVSADWRNRFEDAWDVLTAGVPTA